MNCKICQTVHRFRQNTQNPATHHPSNLVLYQNIWSHLDPHLLSGNPASNVFPSSIYHWVRLQILQPQGLQFRFEIGSKLKCYTKWMKSTTMEKNVGFNFISNKNVYMHSERWLPKTQNVRKWPGFGCLPPSTLPLDVGCLLLRLLSVLHYIHASCQPLRLSVAS